MIRIYISRFCGIVFVVGIGVVAAMAVSGEERPHPSLVDPTKTKCTVCHKDVGETHSLNASEQPCLSCHTFDERANKTVLIVEDAPRERDVDDGRVSVGTSVATNEREGEGVPISQDATTPRSNQPPAETVDEIAPVRPKATAAAPAGTSPSENPDSVGESGGADSAGRLYAEGRAAFNNEEFDRAFNTWRLMLAEKPEHFVVQVEVDTYLESAQSTVAAYGDHSLYVLKKDELYWVFSGFFATQAQAIEAVRLLPEPLRQGGAFPIEVRQVLPQQ